MKQTLKQLFLTKEGWIGWVVANVITSAPWALSFVIGYVFNSQVWYVIGGSIWTFMMLPITPFWILNAIIAVWVVKLLTKKHIKQGI